MINDFLRKISFKSPNFVYDGELKGRVEKRLTNYGISTEVLANIQPCIETAVNVTCTAYSFLSANIQESIALNTTYLFSVDDLVDELRKELREYTTTLMLGQPQKHELL